MNSSNIIQKIWFYSHVLRDAGVSYSGCPENSHGLHGLHGFFIPRGAGNSMNVYLEQFTYLIFLKRIEGTEAAREDFRAVAAALEGAP